MAEQHRVFSSPGLIRLERLQNEAGFLDTRFSLFGDPADRHALTEVLEKIQACEEALRASAESFVPLDY